MIMSGSNANILASDHSALRAGVAAYVEFAFGYFFLKSS
jgi:hypothetical protein